MSTAARALAAAVVLLAVLALLRSAGVGLVGLALMLALVVVALPLLGVRALDAGVHLWRRLRWRHESGRHHAFAGVSLHIVDDGRFVWIVGRDLQRVLHTTDADDVLAARHAGRWRRDDDGLLWLRIDAVVERLATAPGRMDPRTVRLRRYLEREVLYPAANRRSRA